MSMDTEQSLRTKLLQLECHFTWALQKDDFHLNDVLSRLEEQINLDKEKKERLARTHSALAYVQFLLGLHEEAHNNLMTSMELHKECHVDEFHKTLIVTYGNLAWLNYHMKNNTECGSYLEKLQRIRKQFPAGFSLVPEVLGEKGWTFLKFSHKYLESAKECFRKALELEPEEGEWNAGYAIALYRTEYENPSSEYSTTVKQLRRAIDKNPDDDVLKVLLALRLVVFSNYKEAEHLVEEVLEGSPGHPHVLRYVAKFFRIQGRVDNSIFLLTKALERSSDSSFIHHQLALCYNRKKIQLKQGQSHHAKGSRVEEMIDKSIYHLEKATTQRTPFISAMSDLALLYGEKRDMSRAEELFQSTFKTAKEKNDSLRVVHFCYAEFQLNCHRCKALAVKHYMDCLKISPDSVEGKKSGKSLKMIAKKWMRRNSRKGEAYGILGFLHKERGEKHQAIKYYEKALSYGDNDEFLSNLSALKLSL